MSSKDAWQMLKRKLLTVWLPVTVIVLVTVIAAH